MAVPFQVPDCTVPSVEVPVTANMDVVAVPPMTRLPEPQMLPTTVSFSDGVVVAMPTLSENVDVPVSLNVPNISKVYGEAGWVVVPMTM